MVNIRWTSLIIFSPVSLIYVSRRKEKCKGLTEGKWKVFIRELVILLILILVQKQERKGDQSSSLQFPLLHNPKTASENSGVIFTLSKMLHDYRW